MLLLDTNVVSELRKINTPRVNPNVALWQSRVPATDLYISVITLMEIEVGILRLARRDAIQAAILRDWLDKKVLQEFAPRTLPVDQAVAFRCARLHVPSPKPDRDALIAATALVHGMSIVTRNGSDFADLGVTVVNPWTPERGEP